MLQSINSPSHYGVGVTMNFKEIQNYIKKGDYLFSDHADDEKTKDKLNVDQIEEAILSGEVIEERLNDPRGKSRLVAGISKNGKLIHVVIGLKLGRPVIVTVYTPSKEEWMYGKIRLKKGN